MGQYVGKVNLSDLQKDFLAEFWKPNDLIQFKTHTHTHTHTGIMLCEKWDSLHNFSVNT